MQCTVLTSCFAQLCPRLLYLGVRDGGGGVLARAEDIEAFGLGWKVVVSRAPPLAGGPGNLAPESQPIK